MGQSFSLGRISGIRIGVNWSVVLLAYGLAAGQFPAEVPRRPEAEYVVAARAHGGILAVRLGGTGLRLGGQYVRAVSGLGTSAAG